MQKGHEKIFLHFINKGVNLCVNFFLKDDIHGLILFSKHKKDLYNILAKKTNIFKYVDIKSKLRWNNSKAWHFLNK